jgi:hypothetical protein
MIKRTERILIAAFIVASATAGGAIGHYQHQEPDITVMPCSAWADGAHPTIPEYTVQDACIMPDGRLVPLR